MRDLTLEEQNAMLAQALCRRDRLLLLMPIGTGFRIKEVLSVRVRDVCRNGAVLDELTIQRSNLKNGRGRKRKKIRSRTVPLVPELKIELQLFLQELGAAGELSPIR